MKLTKAQKKALWNFCDQADHADLDLRGVHTNTLWALHDRRLIQVSKVAGSDYDYCLTAGPVALTPIGRSRGRWEAMAI